MQSKAVIGPTGQIVIPAGLRKKYGLQAGDTVLFQEERGRLIIERRDYAAIYALAGSLRAFLIEADLEDERRPAHKREDSALLGSPNMP